MAGSAGSQSLTHRKPVRTIEVALGRSESWQADLHRLLHQVVVGDEEGAAVQWQWQDQFTAENQTGKKQSVKKVRLWIFFLIFLLFYGF